MVVKKIYYSSRFFKSLQNLPLKNKKLVLQRERIFRNNPSDPRLRTHKLKGRLKNLYSFSITHSERILFEFVNKNEILFIDIGGHEVYS